MHFTDHFVKPTVIAHRGASAYAPENTLASFALAKKLGASWVEFDVMLAACGEAVVIHDDTLDRTTSGKGKVSDLTYEEIKKLDAGSWFGSQFSNEHVPCLREVIALLVRESISANIEIKCQPGKEREVVIKVLEDVKHYWPISKIPPLFSSFSFEVLEIIRALSPTAWLGFLMHDWQADWERYCDELQCVTVDIHHEILNPERIQAVTHTNRRLLAYTVNEASRARELFGMGVDGIFSNFPDILLS